MRNRSQAVSGLVIAAAGLVAACTEVPSTPPLLPDDAPPFSSRASSGSERPRTLDDEFTRIAREVPGFGGIYYDQAGDLNIYMARRGAQQGMSAAQLTGRLSTQLQALGANVQAGRRVVVREGRYDFAELHAWREQVRPVLGLPGVVFIDTDEAANRVRIGIEAGSSRALIEQWLSRLGVPREVVILSVTEPIRRLSNHRLMDRVRPIGGGLQLIAPGPLDFVVLCTLGFNVRAPDTRVKGFVTNSHCTENPYGTGPTGTPFYQQAVAPHDPANLIGTEVHDAPPVPCIGHAAVCRWSDAAGIQYVPGVPQAFGQLYRTLFPGTATAGSLEIDPANPRWNIIAEKPVPFVGDILHKTGAGTGWTMGPVAYTCVDTEVFDADPKLVLLCQDWVMAGGGFGDSGSPVFERIGDTNDVRLAGILWGGGGPFVAFSAMDVIRFENPGPRPWTTH